LLRRPAQHKDYDPEQYLRDADNRYSFDPESGIYKPKPYDKEKKRAKFKILSLSPFQWGTLILAALTLLFLVKYTNYARLQWKEAKRTSDQSVISANAAQSAAGTADTTLKSSQKSFEIDQRPYLVSQVPEFAELPAPNKEIYANETIKNIGRTPAIRRYTAMSLTRFDAGSKEKLIKFLGAGFNKLRTQNEASAKQMESYAATIREAEMDTAPQDSYFGTNQNSIKLSEDELRNLREGKGIALFYLGLINYRDSFGNSYETQFCYIYFGPYPKVWHICDSHNIIR